MKREEWRVWPANPQYEASTHGRVRSMVGPRGPRPAPRVMRGSVETNGYVRLNMRAAGGGKLRMYQHQVVAETFHGPCPPGHEVRHYPDQSRRNNRPDNLSYSTRSENAQDRHENKTMTLASLTEADVRAIRADTRRTGVIANEYGVTTFCIWSVKARKTWKRVG